MEKQSLMVHRVNARTNLLDFVSEHTGIKIDVEIGKNPERWLEELDILNSMLTGSGLCGGQGIEQPPIGDPDFRELGNGAFLYNGSNDRVRGLWLKRKVEGLGDIAKEKFEWILYRLGTRARLFLNPDYAGINASDLLPENFEARGKKVEKETGAKRPIWRFQARGPESQLEVYAKGSDISLSFLYHPPSYRLTSIAGIHRTTSETEMTTTQKLADLGVNVPKIIGHYKSDFEQFLFLEAVKGTSPDNWLATHKKQIITQDAQMLASLFQAGYTKNGFEDYDDKIFDGEKLWLIDVDECRDLYFTMAPDYRQVLLNPANLNEYNKFRKEQKGFLKAWLMDAIYCYRDSLLMEQKDKELYISTFFRKMRWASPSKSELRRLTTFGKDYQTMASYIGTMCEE